MTLYVPGDSGLRATCNWVGSPLSSCALPLDIQGVGATSSGQMDHSMPGMQQPMKMNSDHKM